jgi:hypothetical protein
LSHAWDVARDAVLGTRGLATAGLLILAATALEGVLPPRLLLAMTGLATALLAVGLLTLSREAASAQHHVAGRGLDDDLARRLGRLLVFPLLLVILLLPRLFLGAYGIPHLTPMAGLLLPAAVRRVALLFLAVVLLAALVYVQRFRRGVAPLDKPRELAEDPVQDDRRLALLAALFLLGTAWLLLLRPFWSPFSLLAWPPGFESLTSARGVTALAVSLAVPLPLFGSLALQAELLRVAVQSPPSRLRLRVLVLTGFHAALALTALALHAYDLLWIARYEAASGQ